MPVPQPQPDLSRGPRLCPDSSANHLRCRGPLLAAREAHDYLQRYSSRSGSIHAGYYFIELQFSIGEHSRRLLFLYSYTSRSGSIIVGYTHSMLTSLPCGQRTVGGFSDGVTFWEFWENARVGRRSCASRYPASLYGEVLAFRAVFVWGIGR